MAKKLFPHPDKAEHPETKRELRKLVNQSIDRIEAHSYGVLYRLYVWLLAYEDVYARK